jgi:hypothetical protein
VEVRNKGVRATRRESWLVQPARLKLPLLDPQVAQRRGDVVVDVAVTLGLAAGSEIPVDAGDFTIY